MRRTVISTDKAPAAVGPYSQAIRIGDLIYTAGQVAIDPSTGQVEAATVEDQTRQVFKNLAEILEAAGSGLDRVVKMTVFMTDLGEFAAMNAVYAEHFAGDPPARSTVEVSALPLGVRVEIEAIATVDP
jgi:2-iminobutanoate/2-iminopropanoate deaminase